MTYPSRKNLIATISPSPYAAPLLLDMVPVGFRFFLGVPVSGVFLRGSGGAGAPFTYSLLVGSGSPPEPAPGLTLNTSTGELTGTPMSQGTFPFVAEVEDSGSNVFAHSFSIFVESGLFLRNGQPTAGEQDVTYRFQFLVYDAMGVLLTSGFTIASGSEPDGLTLNADGTLTGTPTNLAVGVTAFTVNATDGTGSLDIPCSMTVYAPVALTFEEDTNPPNGWGGGPGSWLPSIIRGVDYIANLVITGGVPPYSLTPSVVDPPPTGVNLVPSSLYIRGKTEDAASPNPILIAVQVTDAVGGTDLAQRAMFIIDAQQGRIQPKQNGVDAAGGNGALAWNFVDGSNTTANVSNDGATVTVSFDASGGSSFIRARVATAAALPSNIYNNGSSGVGATLTGVSVGVLTIDGVAVALNDIVIVKNEAAPAHNGTYVVTTLGTVGVAYVLTRDTRMDGTTEFTGVLLTTGPDGSTNFDVTYECTAVSPVTVGTTAITFQAVGGTGVTSVALALPAEFVVSGSPVTSTGTLTGTKATQSANTVWSGPTTGAAAQPAFRALVAADIPSLPYGTGTVTNVSSGNFSPLFNASFSNPTTTPALAFTAIAQAANLVFAGPTSGGSANPTFRALVAADIPSGFLNNANAIGLIGGTGEDGNVNLDGTNTFAGLFSKSGNIYTQLRNAAIGVLKITTGCSWVPNGSHISIQQWDCRTGFYGVINASGTGGSNASGTTAGGAGSTPSAGGAYFGTGGLPTAGTAGTTTNSASNSGGTAGANAWGGSGVSGGKGGNGSPGNAATPGTTGTCSGYNPVSSPFSLIQSNNGGVYIAGGAGGGGTGGGGDNTNAGGGGGGGGGAGIGLDLSVGEIITDGSTPSGMITTNGGNGGNGANGAGTGNTGGGGAGGPGGGGAARLVVGARTGPAVTGFMTANGGNGGNSGTGHGTGTNGTATAGAQNGRLFLYNVAASTWSVVSTVANGTAATGTTGGTGTTASVNL